MKKEFNIGDKVKKIGGSKAKGKIGKVIGFSRLGLVLVQFDKHINGRDGNGNVEGVCGKEGYCWYCGDSELELVKIPDKLIFKGKETILIKDGKEYVSKCADGDEYDKEKGLLLCLAKANGVSYQDLQTMVDTASYEPTDEQQKAVKEIAKRLVTFFEAGFKALRDKDKAEKSEADKKEDENTVKEVKRRAKVGEHIKIVNACVTGGIYENGDILKVYKTDGRCVYCEMSKKTSEYDNDNGNIKIWDTEYVVLENYKPYKITLSEFLKGKDDVAIHCKTENEAKELLAAFDKAGKTWRGGKKYTEETKWEEYKDQTYYYNDGLFSSNMYVEDHDLIVYEFNEVDLDN